MDTTTDLYRPELPPHIEDSLIALMDNESEFEHWWRTRVGDDGQIETRERKQIAGDLWIQIRDLLQLAMMPANSTLH
ncbi:hypothetical protein [Thiorhodovibrio frisius]|uniref:Uncharacterized protein n=1 Tax=Thiorhodovibrio frisius TaxID=631362 RepID=H8Z713_9GAMM|nr:hypothetical protein [Thiorhodovibrio frisius]EIC20812.1 hypothetical protein Thi970DRAFT_04475 [Thiorhodovibrio frisius]WPL21863.1 hypothetical protein Thiofri_02000 [Thiorhodovibrio frisius]